MRRIVSALHGGGEPVRTDRSTRRIGQQWILTADSGGPLGIEADDEYPPAPRGTGVRRCREMRHSPCGAPGFALAGDERPGTQVGERLAQRGEGVGEAGLFVLFRCEPCEPVAQLRHRRRLGFAVHGTECEKAERRHRESGAVGTDGAIAPALGNSWSRRQKRVEQLCQSPGGALARGTTIGELLLGFIFLRRHLRNALPARKADHRRFVSRATPPDAQPAQLACERRRRNVGVGRRKLSRLQRLAQHVRWKSIVEPSEPAIHRSANPRACQRNALEHRRTDAEALAERVQRDAVAVRIRRDDLHIVPSKTLGHDATTDFS